MDVGRKKRDGPIEPVLPPLEGILHPSMLDAVFGLAGSVRLGGQARRLERASETVQFRSRERRRERAQRERAGGHGFFSRWMALPIKWSTARAQSKRERLVEGESQAGKLSIRRPNLIAGRIAYAQP